jgi:hypothetical protein
VYRVFQTVEWFFTLSLQGSRLNIWLWRSSFQLFILFPAFCGILMVFSLSWFHENTEPVPRYIKNLYRDLFLQLQRNVWTFTVETDPKLSEKSGSGSGADSLWVHNTVVSCTGL